MNDHSDDRLAAWPAMLAQLDAAQLEALSVTVAALTAHHLGAEELLDLATEANMAGLAFDLALMQGPDAVAAKRQADTRAGLVARVSELAAEVQAVASDLEMAADRLAGFDQAEIGGS